jgi:acyl-CoA synthetase (AMP-forming)/AMP-acid ligase II
VYDALVVGVADENYGQSVTAVIQARGDHQPEVEEIRSFLRSSLSGYKLPRAVTYVDQIPRSATGKALFGSVSQDLILQSPVPVLSVTAPHA